MEGVWGNRLLILGVWVSGEALLARVRCSGSRVEAGWGGVGWVRKSASFRVRRDEQTLCGCEQNPRAQGEEEEGAAVPIWCRIYRGSSVCRVPVRIVVAMHGACQVVASSAHATA